MKKHLKNIVRKSNLLDKTAYKYVLDQNERNFLMHKGKWQDFINSLRQEDFFFYPNSKKFVRKLAKHIRVREYNIMLTPGSDTAIKTIFEAFELKGKNIVTTNYCFPMYDVYADLYEANLVKARYKRERFKIRNLIEKINEDTEFIIIANPNSPLGDLYTFDEIKMLLDTGKYVVIDEAYIELTEAESVTTLIDEYQNLIVTRTFSKGLGAAGCRLGYIVSCRENMEILSKFRMMYEVNSIGLLYGEYILDNYPEYLRYLQTTIKQKKLLVSQLQNMHYNIVDTDCTWFFIEKTERLEQIFRDHWVSYRTLTLPGRRSSEWIKFNYDLALRNTYFINDLLNEVR